MADLMMASPRPVARPADLQVLDVVARTYGMTPAQMLAPGRDPLVVEARRIAMQVLADKGLGATQIGRVVAREHATVLHHLKVMRGRPSPEEAEMLADVRRELTS